MRKRFENNELSKDARLSGTLNKNEIREISQAYQDGCKGEIIIGLCGEERLLTLLLPQQPSPEDTEDLLDRSSIKLKTTGCDRLIRVRRG